MNIHHYNPKVITWELQENKLHGNISLVTNYGLGLTPPDPQNNKVSYFTIFPTLILQDSNQNNVFKFSIEITYRIENNGIKPSHEELFELIKHSSIIADAILKDKAQKTIIRTKEFPFPNYYHVYPDLVQAVLLAYPDEADL